MARLRRRQGLGLSLLAAAALAVTGAGAPAFASTGTHHARSALVTAPASLVNPFIGTSQRRRRLPRRRRSRSAWCSGVRTRPRAPTAAATSTTTPRSPASASPTSPGPGCGAGGDVPVLPTVGAVNTGATDAFSHTNESASPGCLHGLAQQRREDRADRHHPQRHGALHLPVDHAGQPALQADGQSERRRPTRSSPWSATPRSAARSPAATSAARATPTPSTSTWSSTSRSPPTGRPRPPAAHPKHRRPPAWRKNAAEPANRPSLHGAAPKAKPSRRQARGRRLQRLRHLQHHRQPGRAGQGRLSYVSIANAVANRTAENPGWNFAAVRRPPRRPPGTPCSARSQIAGGTGEPADGLLHRALPLAAAPERHQRHQRPVLRLRRRGPTPSTPATRAAYANYSGWDIYRSQAQLEALRRTAGRLRHRAVDGRRLRPDRRCSPSGPRTTARPT